MKDTDKYNERDWEKLAAKFSGEQTELDGETGKLSAEDNLNTEKKWREIGMTSIKDEINVDNAWNKLHNRLENNGLLTKTVNLGERNKMRLFIRVAAALIIFAGLGAAFLYLGNSGILSGRRVVASAGDQRNIEVRLPDGSRVWLNRNSQLSYFPNPGKKSRSVKLTGEAFFDIVHDASRPFVIDAGKAQIRDIGTSFNVITRNRKDDVEVFVKTGKVMLSDSSGFQEVVLDPGYVGTVGSSGTTKKLNNDQNYLSWNTDLLVYTGEQLKKVFTDLRSVHNINVVADDPEIMNEKISATFDKLSQDTIIRIICTTFNFRYQKEGNNYHLSRK